MAHLKYLSNLILPHCSLYITCLNPIRHFFQISGIAKSLRSIRNKVVLPELIRFSNDAMHSSAPIIRPLWMIDPMDPVTHTIDDQFLIGDRVKVEQSS